VITSLLEPWFAERSIRDVEQALADTSVLWSRYRGFADLVVGGVLSTNPLVRENRQPGVGPLLAPISPLSVVLAVFVVFFVAFFNAYEGGSSVTPEMLYNARLLGGNRARILLQIRGPYAVAWMIAGLPLTITFALLTVVTGELLTGYPGMGQLLGDATSTANAPLTFAVVIVLAVVGVAVVLLADLARNRVLHWWAR